jgi:hypothetical protein
MNLTNSNKDSNMSNQTDLMNEENIEEINHHIEMGEALHRLKENADFKKVILDGYLRDKVLASVSLMAVPQKRGNRPEIIEDINSASALQYFFMMIESFYESAKEPFFTDEELARIEAEEGDNQ